VVLWRDLWAKAIATPMDATVGCLWAEGIADEILFFWRGQRLLAFTRSNWIDDCGRQCRHPPAEPSRGVARPAHCRSSTLLRVLGVAYRAAPSMAASAQSIYAAVSSGLGPQPCHVDGSCADADYGARLFFMVVLSALGSSPLSSFGERSQRRGNQPTTTDVVTDEEGKNSGSDPPGVWSPQSPHSLSIGSGPRTPRYPRVAQ